MALSKKTVQEACKILKAVQPNIGKLRSVQLHTPEAEQQNAILGYDRKSDGGWENIWMNVKDITLDQLYLFDRLKDNIRNTSYIKSEKNGITEIGWY